MQIAQPKDNHSYTWTSHSKYKLFQYAISPNSVKRVVKYPDRKEEGIAEKTIAVMRRKDTKSAKKECWVMYQNIGKKKRIISAWIYPGESPKGREIFVPDEVWIEIEKYSSEDQQQSSHKKAKDAKEENHD